MCECLTYDDGEMHLCLVCADEWREREQLHEKHQVEIERLKAEATEIYTESGELRAEITTARVWELEWATGKSITEIDDRISEIKGGEDDDA